MDHSNVDVNVKQSEKSQQEYDAYVTEDDGKKYRVPYKIIKKVVFTNVSKEEMIDIPHAARLQYRLMLLEPVIKATVDFTKSKITVLFNPREAENIREKMNLDELQEFLVKQGITVQKENTLLEDYDYYKNLYTYAYTPPSIRKRVPYGYTAKEWESMRPEWEKKMQEGEVKKQEKLKEFRESFLDENPELIPQIDPTYKPKVTAAVKVSFLSKVLGKKPTTQKKEKGFWFHGL